MSVIYRDELNSRMNDDFSMRLTEAQEFFAEKHGTNIIGRDIETVFSTNSLFEDYKDKLTEGFDANTAEDLGTLLDATREQVLQESVAGVQPYAALTMPILVKLWARLSMKYAIPTEPVTKPAFAVAFMKPYMIDEDGNKCYLPESINNTPETMVDKKRLTEEITLTDGKVASYDLFEGSTIADTKKGDTVDRKFSIVSVTIDGEEYPTRIALDINRRLYGEVKTSTTDDEGSATEATEIILGSVDLEKATLNLVSMNGTVESVKILGWVSSESHNTAINVSFDLDRRDIEIGTGTHIEANVPLELLQDVKAMYQVDGAAEVIDIMSNVSAQKVDLDIIEFLKRACASSEQRFDGKYTKAFNVYPNAGYHMHPTEWLEGLKKVIDYVAQSMKNDFKSYEGYFVIVGNPLDTMLIPNVNWTFQNAQDTMNGVNVTYSLGAVSGANRYNVIASDLIPQGDLTVFLVPTTDKYKTFVYYPYSFNVVNNYLNTRMQNVPSIMLTRRYTLEEFMPIIGRIRILGNDGSIFGDASGVGTAGTWKATPYDYKTNA